MGTPPSLRKAVVATITPPSRRRLHSAALAIDSLARPSMMALTNPSFLCACLCTALAKSGS